MPATDQTMTQMRSSGMPIDCAAWWSSATARSARPVAVFWKKSASTRDQRRGDHRRVEVFLVDQEAALERRSRSMNIGSFGMPMSIL